MCNCHPESARKIIHKITTDGICCLEIGVRRKTGLPKLGDNQHKTLLVTWTSKRSVTRRSQQM